jgi:hypothetical protein
MLQRSTYYLILIVFFFSCKKQQTPDSSGIFELLTSETTGVDFINSIENTASLNILNYLYFYNGAGVSVGDFNNDGLTDIYFTANQTNDQLYLNKGDLQFEDITKKSFINNDSGWTTGVTTVDINNDGLLDIYVCKVGEYRTLKGTNLLFVNQGTKENGIPTFKEQSKEYGLDISSFSTQAAFFDYDQDNDLDLFLLNHSVHPNRTYGKGAKRKIRNELSGDRLYENQNGKYIDVSTEAGIFQGNIGYGLGVAIGDLNNDSYPDIYVGNDFFENDYLYSNNQDKTFTELINQESIKLGHTTHYSMGNNISDVNNDGRMDILSLDMLPEDLDTYKRSGKEFGYQTYSYYLKNGYTPQFMQNTLHINRGNLNFSETAHMSGIAATEWSWSTLVADFDNDGFKDIYITNGILGATNDMDFINFIANDEIQKKIETNFTDKELRFIDKLPKKKTPNYFFKNENGLQFKDVSSTWLPKNENSYSNGAAYADLDNDGDLDIVVNNINDEAYIIKNNTPKSNAIKVSFNGPEQNPFGIGAKVTLYVKNQMYSQENYPTRSYLSSVEPNLHFGLGQSQEIDSMQVQWSDGKTYTIKSITGNNITLYYSEAAKNTQSDDSENSIKTITDFKHKDNSPIEFNRDPLIPYALSNYGPDISVADINNDGLDDFFISGAKRQASSLFLQDKNGNFYEHQNELWAKTNLNEDVAQDFGDANGDGFTDLIVVSGGNEFKSGKAIQPRLYLNNQGTFSQDLSQFQGIEFNASKVKFIDFDNDQDLDICMLADADKTIFGKSPQQYLLENDGKGNFKDVTETIAPDFQHVGNAKDFVFTDVDQDGFKDLIIVGHWMPITVFLNQNNKFVKSDFNGFEKTNGWWNTIKAEDFDKDGDIDLIVGNWGLNSRLKSSEDEPITLYSYDFDNNGSKEPIVSYFYQGEETTFSSKEELEKQLPIIKKKYVTHEAFAEATFEDIFTSKALKKADKKQVFELASCYFENQGNQTFKKHILPYFAQISSVNDIFVHDFNNDSYLDVLIGGNNYEVSTQLSKLDASHGEVLLNNQQGSFSFADNLNFDIQGVVQSLRKIKIQNKTYLLVGRNNDSILSYDIDKFRDFK